MARNFNGIADFAQASLTLSAYKTITVAFWAINNSNSNFDELFCEYGPNANSTKGFYSDPNFGNQLGTSGFFLTGDNQSSGVSGTQGYFSWPSQGVWHQYVYLFDMSVNLGSNAQWVPAVYVDGVSQSLTYLSAGGVTLTTFFTNQTLNFMCRNGASLFNAGKMADFAIWGGVLLTAGEASALAKGARPYTIRTASLVNWWPMDGIQSPDPDLSGNAKNQTVTGGGAVLAPGPPVMPFTPRWGRFVGWTPMLSASGLGWIINRRNKLMVPKKRA